MPQRATVHRELASLLSVLSHPHRLALIFALEQGPLDVNSLAALVGLAHATTSQHLSLLRAHRLVDQQRDGRHVRYSLADAGLARWLADAMRYLELEAKHGAEVHHALRVVRARREAAVHKGPKVGTRSAPRGARS